MLMSWLSFSRGRLNAAAGRRQRCHRIHKGCVIALLLEATAQETQKSDFYAISLASAMLQCQSGSGKMLFMTLFAE